MFMLAKLRWTLLVSVLALSFVAVLTNVEAAIEITIIPENKKELMAAESMVDVPKPLQQKKLRIRSIPSAETKTAGVKNLIVNGYKDNVFVYGELKNMPGGGLEGYLYSGNQSTYVYGELRKKEQIIQAHDVNGQLYLLEIVKK